MCLPISPRSCSAFKFALIAKSLTRLTSSGARLRGGSEDRVPCGHSRARICCVCAKPRSVANSPGRRRRALTDDSLLQKPKWRKRLGSWVITKRYPTATSDCFAENANARVVRHLVRFPGAYSTAANLYASMRSVPESTSVGRRKGKSDKGRMVDSRRQRQRSGGSAAGRVPSCSSTTSVAS
jgi:hypothetical protein